MMRPFVFISLLLLFLNGCALFSRKPFSPVQKQYPPGLSPAEISLLIKERHKPFQRLWASGKITLWGKGIKGKKYFQATILFREPDLLRLRGSRMITSTLFEFIVNSGRMAVVWNREKTWFEGDKEEWMAHPDLSLGIDPLFLPKALLIHQELINLFEDKRITRWQKKGRLYLFLSEGTDDSREAFLVGIEDLLIREAALYSSEGLLDVRLKFLRYDSFDGEILPEEMEIFFPQTSITARVQISDYKYPESFDKAVFSLSPPPGYESHAMQDLVSPPLTAAP